MEESMVSGPERHATGPHAWRGFNPSNINPSNINPSNINPSNINYELCRYTDDVTRMAGLFPATSTLNSATTLMASHVWPGFNPGNIVEFNSIHECKLALLGSGSGLGLGLRLGG
jgi:hypothetical protein